MIRAVGRLRARARARLAGTDNDAGMMAFALLAVLVASGLAATLLPLIVSQSQSTRSEGSRVVALHAAQSGIDVVIGEIRAATLTTADGAVLGNSTALPCGPISGNANGTGATAYSATVQYYAVNPASSGASVMTCATGFGPFDSNLNTHTPRYAVITSTGTVGTSGNGVTPGRTLQTTYVFQTDDSTTSGGQIKIFPSGSTNYCMDAQSATPATGTALLLRTCSSTNPPASQQVFAYRSDLTIQLVSSVTKTNPAGLCLDTNPTTHGAGIPMVLNLCTNPDPTKPTATPWNQEWSVDDNAHLEGEKSDKSAFDGFCIHVAAQADGQPVVLNPCAGGVTDTSQTWVPSASAGAGAAGTSSSQLVNYKYFATCFDVTGQDPNAAYLILYTCKQNPDQTKIAWNQKITPYPSQPTQAAGPTKVLLRVNDTANGTTYCLQSPLTTGGYVTITTPCPASVSAASSKYVWTIYQTNDSSGNDLPYAQKYTIVDSAGLCLGPGANNDLLNGQYYKLLSASCDGTTAQKWNANPSIDQSKEVNTVEK